MSETWYILNNLNGNSSHGLYIFYPQLRWTEKKVNISLVIKIRDTWFSNASLIVEECF